MFEVAESRPDLKRRLRMELAAEQGPGPLAGEIDKRLTAFETSRGKITWRQRPAFIRDLDALRALVALRLAPLDPDAAAERLLRFIDTARQANLRYREREDELSQVFGRAAQDLGPLLARAAAGPAALALVESLKANPVGWKAWLPGLLESGSSDLAGEALRQLAEHRGATPGWITLIRQLADAAGELDALMATYTAEALKTPGVAAEIAQRLLAAQRVDEAGQLLKSAVQPKRGVDIDWESAWIDYLQASGQADAAQAARWASFERTMSVDRLKTYLARLDDFDDVEAEGKAMELAAGFADFQTGLGFLITWPSLPAAAGMVEQRQGEIDLDPDTAELWAGKLRRRHSQAALLLLRRSAASAFRRRDFKGCDRLTAEAEAIDA
ncbi:hypothetical protein LJR164_004591 [Phenylobacterium sp. LjRoot164]